MKVFRYHIGIVLMLLLLALTIPYAWHLLHILFLSPHVSVLGQLALYQWVAIGAAVFVPLRRFMHSNITWLETFSHELTHIVVALMFLRRVHSFQAGQGTGNVCTSGTSGSMIAPMALAPYCLPIFTFLLLIFRSLMNASTMWIYDILIGASITFHVGCFVNQTGRHQTDINQFPLPFSYLFIYTARLVNACIILVAFFPRYNVFTSCWRYLVALYDNVLAAITYIF